MEQYLELFEQYPDTIIIFGEHCLLDFENLLRQLKPKKILVFTGKNSAVLSSAWQGMLRTTVTMDTAVVRFSDIGTEPDLQTVDHMVKTLIDEAPDEVAAIGGGSIMDAAKAAFLTYQTGGSAADYFGINRFSQANPDRKLKKVICFPTTAGTGSEVTPYANIVDRQNQCKRLIVETEIIPEYAFVSPDFARTMPRQVALTTGCDALAHALEGFLNINADNVKPEANDWAYNAIELIVHHLPIIINGNHSAAAVNALSAAATLGGMVIRYKPTGLPHLCSFSWFERITHGLAVAILLEPAWRYYLARPEVRTRTMRLSGLFPGDTPEAVVDSYKQFIVSLGVPQNLRAFPGITPDLLRLTAQSAGQNRMKLEQSPFPVPFEQSETILSTILHQAYSS